MSSVDTSLFKTDLVFFDFEAHDRFELFEKLGRILKERGYITDTWLEAIETRERDYPTGLAFENISVAIPHVDPEHLIKPYIAIVKPKEPVVFEGMAGIGGDVPAQLVVNLGLLAHAEGQIAVLQALMGVFVDAEAAEAVMACATADDMVATMKRLCA